MTSIFNLFLIIPIINILLLAINFILAPHKPYKEKKTPFECGYHSFLAQNRTQFTISFFLFGILFLLFDTEILIIYPLTVSSYFNAGYGIFVVIIFVLVLALGFVFELGKGALKIDTKQNLVSLQSGFFPFLRNIKYLVSNLTSWVNKLLFALAAKTRSDLDYRGDLGFLTNLWLRRFHAKVIAQPKYYILNKDKEKILCIAFQRGLFPAEAVEFAVTIQNYGITPAQALVFVLLIQKKNFTCAEAEKFAIFIKKQGFTEAQVLDFAKTLAK